VKKLLTKSEIKITLPPPLPSREGRKRPLGQTREKCLIKVHHHIQAIYREY